MIDHILGVYHRFFEVLQEKMMSLLDRDQDAASGNHFGIESSMFKEDKRLMVLRALKDKARKPAWMKYAFFGKWN